MTLGHQPPEASVIDDVRRARRALLASCGDNLHELFVHLSAAQAEHPERVMNLRERKKEATIRRD